MSKNTWRGSAVILALVAFVYFFGALLLQWPWPLAAALYALAYVCRAQADYKWGRAPEDDR